MLTHDYSHSDLEHNPAQWWKQATIYQIYPASFKDSNGDGKGDLPGILEKLDYIKSIGVDAIWICPFYESPGYDMGYDVSNYQRPDPAYGTSEDIEAVIKGCHERGLKIICDLVINHTSHLHPWFMESQKSKDSKFRDYYIWKKPRYDENGRRMPPTNWRSVFGGSTWEYSEATDEYYLHLFLKEQPDLNWEKEEVRDAIFQEAVTFWLDKGVDGFRIDTSTLYSKPAFEDVEVVDPFTYDQPCQHIVNHGPKLSEYLQELNRKTFAKYSNDAQKGDIVTIAEIGGNLTTPLMLDLVGSAQKKVNMAIRFELTLLDHDDDHSLLEKPLDLKLFKEITAQNQELADPQYDGWPCVYLENHDQARSISRYASDAPEDREMSAKMLCIYMTTLSGTLLVYQGQEIGMINAPDTWDVRKEFKDLATQQYLDQMEQILEKKPGITREQHIRGVRKLVRENCRTPMQWNADHLAGFSTAKEAWMRVIDSYRNINVDMQEMDPNSVLNFWREMLIHRKQHAKTFIYGTFHLLAPSASGDERLFGYVKTSRNGHSKTLVLLNFSPKELPFEFPSETQDYDLELLVSTVRTNIPRQEKTLQAWEGRVYVTTKNVEPVTADSQG